ncbi:hypothetical protein DSECCO2_637160 [anaerobic digester metagenome]
MQPPGGVADDDVGATGLARLQCIMHDGSGVGTLRMGNHRSTGALAPDAQLLNRRRSEGIGRGQQHFFTRSGIARGQFADAGGLSHAVDADHQQYAGRIGNVVRALDVQNLPDDLFDDRTQRSGVGQALLFGALAQLGDNQLRGLHTDIRHDKLFLQLFKIFVVNARGKGDFPQSRADI